MSKFIEHSHIQRKNAQIDQADDKLTLADVLTKLTERDVEIKAFVAKANSEIAASGKIATDTKASLELLSKTGIELQERLLEVEQKLARRNGANGSMVKTIGEQFTETDIFKSFQERGRGTANIRVKAVSNITSATTGDGGAGVAIVPERIPGIVTQPDRQLTVRDLLLNGRTNSNAIEYVQETGFTNNAAPVKEGEQKPQSSLKFELKTTTVKTIAHWFKASRQVLQDIPLLQSYINGRAIFGLKYAEEQQLLAGDGTGENLLGLIPQATSFNNDLRKAGDTKIDTLRRAILQVRLAEYRASAIVLNPMDWADIELEKNANGSYIWVNVQEGGVQRMWRLPVIDTTAVAKDNFLVGAFNIAAEVFDREDANVEVSTEDGDNFTKNMVTIRAEERLALVVSRPESFVHGSFTAPSSGA